MNLSAVINATLYPSPNHQRELVFKKACYFVNCINEAYENRGIFQRKVYVETNSDTSELFQNKELWDNYLKAFHDPSQINLAWSKDNNAANWTVQFGSESVEGIVNFGDS
ncbi:MAG: hypothetical protein MJA27_06615 [Pseudanabaenales cyanobacterium]|nr:hypothetical protein [Pseudanabaenales cyanobacterium]